MYRVGRMKQSFPPVERLLAQGFRAIPIQPGTKRPLPGRGIDSAQGNLAGIDPTCYALVPPLGVVVLDFDAKNGRNGWAEFCAQHDEPPQGFVVTTPSGGRHVYLRVPAELGVVRNHPVITGAVDVRGQRGYVLGPGCPGYTLLDEEIAEIPLAPDWMFGLLSFDRSPQTPSHSPALAVSRIVRPEPLDGMEWADLRAALSHVPSDDYHTWVRMGHALAMAAPDDNARELWLDWSAKSAKFESRAAERKWAELVRSANGTLTHRTVFQVGMQHGWPNVRSRPIEELVHEQQQIVDPKSDDGAGFIEALSASASKRDAFPWDALVSVMDGPLLDAIEWIEACNPRSLRIAALGAAIAGLGGALAHRVYVQWSPGTAARPSPVQQPVVVIARSGAGKDAPLRCATRMIELAGYKSLPGLPYHPVTLHCELVRGGGTLALCVDEMDGTFASLHGRGEHAAAKEAMIKTMLSCGEHLAPPAVAAHNMQRSAIDEEFGAGTWARGVQRPALTVFGVSTRGVLDRLASNVAGGLVGRLLVLDADAPLAHVRQPRANSSDPSSSVSEWIARLAPQPTDEDVIRSSAPGVDAPLAVLVPELEAREALARVAAELTDLANAAAAAGDEHLADLLARAVEAVARVASFWAVAGAADPLTARIEARHVLAAHALVLHCARGTARETSQREEAPTASKTVRLIRDRLSRNYVPPRGSVSREPSPWHYRVLVLRGIEAGSKVALDAMIASGEVVVEGKRLALTVRVAGQGPT